MLNLNANAKIWPSGAMLKSLKGSVPIDYCCLLSYIRSPHKSQINFNDVTKHLECGTELTFKETEVVYYSRKCSQILGIVKNRKYNANLTNNYLKATKYNCVDDAFFKKCEFCKSIDRGNLYRKFISGSDLPEAVNNIFKSSLRRHCSKSTLKRCMDLALNNITCQTLPLLHQNKKQCEQAAWKPSSSKIRIMLSVSKNSNNKVFKPSYDTILSIYGQTISKRYIYTSKLLAADKKSDAESCNESDLKKPSRKTDSCKTSHIAPKNEEKRYSEGYKRQSERSDYINDNDLGVSSTSSCNNKPPQGIGGTLKSLLSRCPRLLNMFKSTCNSQSQKKPTNSTDSKSDCTKTQSRSNSSEIVCAKSPSNRTTSTSPCKKSSRPSSSSKSDCVKSQSVITTDSKGDCAKPSKTTTSSEIDCAKPSSTKTISKSYCNKSQKLKNSSNSDCNKPPNANTESRSDCSNSQGANSVCTKSPSNNSESKSDCAKPPSSSSKSDCAKPSSTNCNSKSDCAEPPNTNKTCTSMHVKPPFCPYTIPASYKPPLSDNTCDSTPVTSSPPCSNSQNANSGCTKSPSNNIEPNSDCPKPPSSSSKSDCAKPPSTNCNSKSDCAEQSSTSRTCTSGHVKPPSCSYTIPASYEPPLSDKTCNSISVISLSPGSKSDCTKPSGTNSNTKSNCAKPQNSSGCKSDCTKLSEQTNTCQSDGAKFPSENYSSTNDCPEPSSTNRICSSTESASSYKSTLSNNTRDSTSTISSSCSKSSGFRPRRLETRKSNSLCSSHSPTDTPESLSYSCSEPLAHKTSPVSSFKTFDIKVSQQSSCIKPLFAKDYELHTNKSPSPTPCHKTSKICNYEANVSSTYDKTQNSTLTPNVEICSHEPNMTSSGDSPCQPTSSKEAKEMELPCHIFRERSSVPAGVSKSEMYKNPEYYSYHAMTFHDVIMSLQKHRLPQPSSQQHRRTRGLLAQRCPAKERKK